MPIPAMNPLRAWLLLGGLFWAACAAAWAQVPKAEEVAPGPRIC